MAREFSRKFYKSKEWLKVREAVLMRDRYLCQDCGRCAEEVHHIIHLTPENIYDVSVSLNMDNLVSLCHLCHGERHKGERAKGRQAHQDDEPYQYTFDSNGQLIPKNQT